MSYDLNILKKYLHDILTIPSPSGYTEEVMDYVKKELDALKVPYISTNKGALIATLKGKDETYAKTFSAHVDTLGAIVKGIKSTGALQLTSVGGYMGNSIEGENCIIHTMDNTRYSGTIQTIKPSTHISGNEADELKRSLDNMEVIIDEKVFSKEDVQKLGIDVGDFISFDSRTRFTESGFVKSRHLDDKASVSILLYTMRYLVENNITLPHTLNFFISNYEEVGHGASAAIPEHTKEFIAVDMGCPGLDQNSTEYDVCICAKDSSGPYDFELRKRLVELCRKENIPYKVDTYPHYGSDASSALRSGNDIKAGLIGAGIFASHGYERTHMDSILATLDLVVKYSQL
ncbi:M42 family metallopeptidase [Hathewaya limosa]|uniref:Aminopeptidase FrvX n=1 Tax=Hathewaya limosa TaxID=1536 RepID=A0ABU0JU49_HATLI|nr:M42 family metallopeptidase [Hathewaya limosa]AWZ47813.1 aminopeptidase [Clostridiaceae bacterium 14S0207]MDQ0480628.1 putative aminopeptidase FrvX [Hathewaya limosa]